MTYARERYRIALEDAADARMARHDEVPPGETLLGCAGTHPSEWRHTRLTWCRDCNAPRSHLTGKCTVCGLTTREGKNG